MSIGSTEGAIESMTQGAGREFMRQAEASKKCIATGTHIKIAHFYPILLYQFSI
jgi:hypothetical protein